MELHRLYPFVANFVTFVITSLPSQPRINMRTSGETVLAFTYSEDVPRDSLAAVTAWRHVTAWLVTRDSLVTAPALQAWPSLPDWGRLHRPGWQVAILAMVCCGHWQSWWHGTVYTSSEPRPSPARAWYWSGLSLNWTLQHTENKQTYKVYEEILHWRTTIIQ